MQKQIKRIIVSLFMGVACAFAAAPSSLKCDNKTNPANIETENPSFSWSASTQCYYQLILSGSADFGTVKWDTGIVTSTVQSCVYAGGQLSGNTTYYWKVQSFDVSKAPSGYSSTATFGTNYFFYKNSFAAGDINSNEDVGNVGVGDLDGDGDLDLVLGGKGTEAMVRFYDNDGAGNFTQRLSMLYGKDIGSIVLRDINNDGLNDVIAGGEVGYGSENESTKVLINNGGFSFTLKYELSSKKSPSTLTYDFNNDGKYDIAEGLASGGVSGEKNTYYAGTGDGTFSQEVNVSTESHNTQSIASADFDNDGFMDIVALNYRVNTDATRTPYEKAYVYKGSGGGGFKKVWTSPTEDYFWAAGVGDFNGDGLADFIAATKSPDDTSQNSEIGIFINHGNMNFSKDFSFGGPHPFATSLAEEDINMDGYTDLIVGWYGGVDGKYTRVYLNKGNGDFALLDQSENSVYAQAVACGDFDGDGDIDYIAGNGDGCNYYYSTMADDGNANSVPNPPADGFSFKWASGKLCLDWGKGSDAETPDNILQYNLGLWDESGIVLSTTTGNVFGECSGLFGNMQYSTWTVLSIPRKTYFFAVETIDAQGFRSAPSTWTTVNEKPYPGWTDENVLASTCCYNYSLDEILADQNKKGKIVVNFKIKDYEKNPCTLNSFEFSLDSGLTWSPLNNPDSEWALEYFNQSFNSDDYLSAAPENYFTWQTKHPDNPSVVRSTYSTSVRIRFKASDGYDASTWCVSGVFEIDNARPATPGDMSFTGKYSYDSICLAFGSSSSDPNFGEYVIYYNDDPSGTVNNAGDSVGSWDYSNDPNLGFADFNTASSTTITGLSEDTTYYFRIYAYDTFGNDNGSLGEISAKTNSVPKLTPVSAAQRKDGSDKVDCSFLGTDHDRDSWQYVLTKLHYLTDNFSIVSCSTDTAFTYPLHFCSTGTVNNFVFDAKADLGAVYYNDNAQVMLTASDGINESSTFYSGQFTIDTKKPEGVTGFKEKSRYSSSVKLQWNLNEDNSSIPIEEDSFSKFIIRYGTSSGVDLSSRFSEWGPSQQSTLSNKYSRTATVSSLKPGTRYYFRLYVYDLYGNYTAAPEVNAITGSGPASSFDVNPAQSGSGDGMVQMTVTCQHPDSYDCMLSVLYSTAGASADAPWYNATLLTSATAYYSTGQSTVYIEPPGIDNTQYYQAGSTGTLILTSTASWVQLDLSWDSRSDLPGKTYDNVYMKTVIKDIYGIEQFADNYSDSFIVDNKIPAVTGASYSHGSENYSSGNSAKFKIFCNKSLSQIDFPGIDISTVNPVAVSSETLGAVHIGVEQGEYDSSASSSVLYFNLSSSTWKQIAVLGRNSSELYLHLSTAAFKDSFGNELTESSVGISWSRDIKSPLVPDGAVRYQQNTTAPGKPTGIRIQFDEPVGGLASDFNDKMFFYTSTDVSQPETPISFAGGLTVSTQDVRTYWFYPTESEHVRILNMGVDKLYFACNEFCYDISGNYIQDISRSAAIYTPLTRETSAPWIYSASPQANSKVAPSKVNIWVKFSETMYSQSINRNTIYLKAVKNSAGETVDDYVNAYTFYFSTSQVVRIIPKQPLGYGYTYRLTVSTAVTDVSMNPLLSQWTLQFQTLYDLSGAFSVSTGPVTITVSANALSGSGSIKTRLDNTGGAISAAFEREKLYNDESHRRLVGGVVTVSVYDSSGTLRAGNFANDVSISYDYIDNNADGFVDGKDPPLRAESLAIYWLSGTTYWLRLPTSRVDTASKKVTAKINHFSSYALMGSALFNTSDAHPYPVPYRKWEDSNGFGIRFTKMPSIATIKIYDIMGRMLREFSYSDATAAVPGVFDGWKDVELPSGVYIYRIQSGESTKSGKLVIVQ